MTDNVRYVTLHVKMAARLRARACTPAGRYGRRMAAPLRIAQHPIWAAQEGLHDLLRRLPEPILQQQPDVINRARAVVQLLRERLSDPAANAISDTALTNGHSWVQNMLAELQNAVNQNNPGVVAQGTPFYANLESLAQNIGQYPLSQPSDMVTALAEEAQARLNQMQAVQAQHETESRTLRDQQQRLIEDASTAKDAGLRRLREQEAAAGKLLAALGAAGTSTGYKATADAEQRPANLWRLVTLVGGVLTAVLAVVLFTSVHSQGVASIATRAGVTLPALLLSVYAGRQSAGHREQEREARRLQLAFGSVDAYLADLDGGQRAALKSQLSERLFGAAPTTSGATGDYPTSKDLVTLLSEAIQRLR